MKRDCVCPRARHEHGTWRAYRSDHCHCRPCRDAWADYTRHYRTRQHVHGNLTVPSLSTALRLQALGAIGWSASALADKLGVKPYIIQTWRIARTETVHIHTHTRIAALYDELWDKPQPSIRVRNEARRRGWLPPLMLDDDQLDRSDRFQINPERDAETPGFIDHVAVERACLGDRVPLTRAELTYAVDTLTRMGYGADETATRLGVSSRLVQRYRAKGKAA